MFHALFKLLQLQPENSFFSWEHCVYDWMRLGLFTGFRVSEYGQNKLRRGEKFRTLPSTPDVPSAQRGKPVAFIITDFVFYDCDHRQVPYRDVWTSLLQGKLRLLEITWRYDKSPTNFSVRKFFVTRDPIFCPVSAAASIIHRAILLGVPPDEPIGVWSTNGSTYRFVKDKDVAFVLRVSVLAAFPDPDHFMRQHISQVVPHSNRVTAAVCLKQGGVSNDDIAFRLRWSPMSVPTYLRDCFTAVGDMLQKTLYGAMALSFN